jgi:hypothetical protein
MNERRRKIPEKVRVTTKSQWTFETLREHFVAIIAANEVKYNERFESSQSAINTALIAQKTAMETALIAQKLAVDTAQTAADRAVNKAEVAAEKRFESVNEFRNTLADQQRTLMPRSEAEILFKSLTEKIDANIQAMAKIEAAKTGAREVSGYVLTIAGIGLTLIAILIPSAIAIALHFIH